MVSTDHRPTISLEAFLENPIDHIEWIDGHLIENSEMTAKTGRIQAKLARYWRNHQRLPVDKVEKSTQKPPATPLDEFVAQMLPTYRPIRSSNLATSKSCPIASP